MHRLDRLDARAAELGIPVDYRILREDDTLDGLYIEWVQFDKAGILINSHRPINVQVAALAEEIGHFQRSYGQIIKLDSIQAIKSEHSGRVAAYQNLLPCSTLKAAMRSGTCTLWELAEFFDLPEGFVKEAFQYYRQRGEFQPRVANCHWCYAV